MSDGVILAISSRNQAQILQNIIDLEQVSSALVGVPWRDAMIRPF